MASLIGEVASHLCDRCEVLETKAARDGGLTPREREVLALLVKGLSYPEIGRVLGIGVGTIQSHIKRIYSKLDVSSKAEAALEAARRGLVAF